MANLLINVLLLVSSVEAFWRMNCAIIQTGRIDPIINPGALAQHAHTIVGASNIGVNATYGSLVNSACNSCEISPDKSAYWSPNLYYQRPNGSFEYVYHGGSVIYYLGRGRTADGKQNITPFPKGFQMVAGNKSNRRYNATGNTWGNSTYPGRPIQDAISYACLADRPGAETPNMVNVSRCINGLRAQIHFQTCWNGRDLYRSDNSHVAFLSSIDDGVCPPNYNVLLPHIFMEVNYAVKLIQNANDGGRFVFSMGDPTGYGFHGDFQNGWDVTVQKNAIQNCLSGGGFGTIEECPILQANRNIQFGRNCPERPSQVGEEVRGMLNKLPGCIRITNGPDSATAADMECPAGVPRPSITRTADSVPLATANPAIGQNYGNAFNKYVGCGNDSVGSPLRTLNAFSTTLSGMTVEMCQTFCKKRGYRYSGVEFGQECHCDLALNPTAIFRPGVNMSSGCTMTCPGSRSQLCGGPAYMNVYNNTDPDFVPTTDISNSVLQLLAPVKPFKEVAPSATYLGCYSEGRSGRTLQGISSAKDNMTVTACAAYCKDYQYFGTEFGSQCYCSNLINPSPDVRVLDTVQDPLSSSCGRRCVGDFGQICGGSGTINVYQNGEYKPVVIQETAGAYRSKGCLTDPARSGRALTGPRSAGDDMTPDKCAANCQVGGYRYFGVEYARECYCGNEVSAVSGAQQIACPMASLMPCKGNKYAYCGGSALMNFYSTVA